MSLTSRGASVTVRARRGAPRRTAGRDTVRTLSPEERRAKGARLWLALSAVVAAAVVAVVAFAPGGSGEPEGEAAPAAADPEAAGERAPVEDAARGPTPRAEEPAEPERSAPPTGEAAPASEAASVAERPVEGGPPEGASEPTRADAWRVEEAGADPDEAGEEGDARMIYAPTASGIRAAMAEALPDIGECYEAWIEAHPELAGKIVVRFTVVADDGADEARVTETRLVGSDVAHPLLEGCVLNVASSLRFDPPAGGSLVVSYPFRFDSGEGDDAGEGAP